MSVTLQCSQEQFERLHDQLARTRSTSQTATVDRAALTALLIDHSNLLKVVKHEQLR